MVADMNEPFHVGVLNTGVDGNNGSSGQRLKFELTPMLERACPDDKDFQ